MTDSPARGWRIAEAPYVIVCADCAPGHRDVGHRTLRIDLWHWVSAAREELGATHRLSDEQLTVSYRCFTCHATIPETQDEVTGVWRLDLEQEGAE